MKPFDIKKAKAGATVQTRNGQRVYIDDYSRNFYGQTTIVGRIEGGIVEVWNLLGQIRTDGRADPLDLVLA